MIPRVEFYLCDLDEVAERIFSFRKEVIYGADKIFSSIHLNLTPPLISKISTETTLSHSTKQELIEVLKKQYPPQEELQFFKENLEKEWEKVNDLFFNELKKECGFQWKHKIFRVGILANLCGHYGEKNIVYVAYAPFKKNEFFYPAFVVAEEIFHLGYWDKWEQIFKIKVNDPDDIHCKGESFSVWHISELLPEYYLKSPAFQFFNWHKFDRVRGYPWILKIKQLADPLWRANLNFNNFILSLHRTCGCFPKR